MMKKALSIFGCLLLSMGTSLEGAPISDMGYWWAIGDDLGSACTHDGNVVKINTSSGVVYRTVETARAVIGEDDLLNFTSDDVLRAIGEDGYFTEVEAVFTTPYVQGVTNLPIDNLRDAQGEFAFRTLLFAIKPDADSPAKLAFFEGGEKLNGRIAAVPIVTDMVISEDEPVSVVVRAFSNATFRVYVWNAEAQKYLEVTVDGATKTFKSLQNPNSVYYAVDKIHSFAFTGMMDVKKVDFGIPNPVDLEYESIPLVLEYDENAVQVDYELTREGETTNAKVTEVKNGDTLKLSVTKKDPTKYDYAQPGISGNKSAWEQVVTDSTITLNITATSGSKFKDNEPIVVKLPSKAYFMTVKINGVPTHVASFEEAIDNAAKGDGKIELANDVDVDGDVALAQANIKVGQTIVFDLKGKKIVGKRYRDITEAAVYNRGALTIIDSVGGGVIEAPGFIIGNEETYSGEALKNNEAKAKVTIKAGTFNGAINNAQGTMQIDGGKFHCLSESETVFYLTEQSGVTFGAYFSEPRLVEGYWVGLEVPEGKAFVEYRLVYGAQKKAYGSVVFGEGESATTNHALVDKGATAPIPDTIIAPGFDTENIVWKGEDGLSFNFAGSSIREATLIIGEMTSISYSVRYDYLVEKGSYKVDEPSKTLPTAERSRFWEFAGWQTAEGEKVDSLGDFAKYSSGEVIAQDLELFAIWQPVEVVWENTDPAYKLKGANGYHTFEWDFRIPYESGALTSGSYVKIDKIALGIVNGAPKNLSRVAPYLRISNDAGQEVARSDEWSYAELSSSDELPRLKNGRVAIEYTFENLTLQVGVPYKVSFAQTSGEGDSAKAKSLVRLALTTDTKYTVIDHCPSTGCPSSDYQFYTPLYEIHGKAEEGESK